jgi:hypothetical protein
MKSNPAGRELTLPCPFCGSKILLSHPDGNTIDVPLVCNICGRRFTPRFYCPDRKAERRHIFESQALYLDNLGRLYTFCPEHTFTTYDMLGTESDDKGGTTGFLRRYVNLLYAFVTATVFRLALTLEGARQHLFPSTGLRTTFDRAQDKPFDGAQDKPFTSTGLSTSDGAQGRPSSGDVLSLSKGQDSGLH